MSRQAKATDDSILAWLLNVDDREPSVNEEILKTIIDDVRIFREPAGFLSCVSALSGYQLFVVLGRGRTPVLRDLWDFDWIVCIYLQGLKDEDNDAVGGNRIRGTNMDASELFIQLSQDVTVFRRTPMHLTFCTESDENSTQSIQQQEARFMWSQLLLETILLIPRTSSIKETYKEIIEESRLCYKGNTKELNRIDQFLRTYAPDQAIYWYTLDAFLYRVLNRALRTQNIMVIYKFRFILQDMYQQLSDLCKAEQSKLVHGVSEPLLVYHGQMIPAGELINFRRNIGKVISMNSFLSMTPDREMALGFSGFGQQRPLLESVVFEIILPTKYTSDLVPFADVTQLSAIPDEQEVLLSMGGVLRIESIESDSNNNVEWIRLSLCSYNSTRFGELKNFSQLLLNNPQKDEIYLILYLSSLLDSMGESEKAMHMTQLAKKRADELGITDSSTDFCNALRQYIQFPMRGGASQKGIDSLNEISSSADRLTSEFGHIIPEIQPMLTLCKNFFGPLTNAANQLASGRRTEEISVTNFNEDLYENFPDHFQRALQPLTSWMESVVPTEHPIRSQLSFLQSLQNKQTANSNTRNLEQLEGILKQLQETGGPDNPICYQYLQMMALQAEDMKDEEKALDLYIQMLEIHDPSLQRHVQNQTDTNLKIAELLEKRGNLEAACEFYTNVINIPQLPPDSHERYQALRARASLSEKLCQWKASLDDYQSIRELERRYEYISYNLSFYDDITIARLQQKLQEENVTNE